MHKSEHARVAGEESEALANQVSAALDNSLDQVSPEVQARLKQARISAMANSERKSMPSVFLPVGGAAFALGMLLILVWPSMQETDQGLQAIAFEEQLEDLILVSEMDEETLAVVEEIEFAYWLAQEMPAETADGLDNNVPAYPVEGRIESHAQDQLGVVHNG